jgi:hypothetical protein
MSHPRALSASARAMPRRFAAQPGPARCHRPAHGYPSRGRTLSSREHGGTMTAGPHDTHSRGVDGAELAEEDLLRELGHLHETRNTTFLHGSDDALAAHTGAPSSSRRVPPAAPAARRRPGAACAQGLGPDEGGRLAPAQDGHGRRGPRPEDRGADRCRHPDHEHRDLRLRPPPVRPRLVAGGEARGHPRARADGSRRGGRRGGHPHQARRHRRRPFNISCGSCFMCTRQLFSQCETTQNLGGRKGASLFGYTHMYGGVPAARRSTSACRRRTSAR